jgi:hypothetical protein
MSVTESIDQSWNTLKSACTTAINKFVPIKKRSNNTKPWISKKTINLLRNKNKWHKKWRGTLLIGDRSKFEKSRKLCKKSLTKDKKEWIQRAFKTEDCRRFWSQVKGITKTRREEIPDLTEGDNHATSDAEKAELLKVHFHKIWTDSSDNIQVTESGPLNCDDVCHPLLVYKQLKRLKANKAVGPDGIYPTLLKRTANILAEPIAQLITRSWNEGQIPNDWRKAIVVPVAKNQTRL